MTGAVVLMGVAVCAAAGCVSVRGEAAPSPSAETVPSRGATVPPGGEDAEPPRERPQLREAPSRPLPRHATGGAAEDADGPDASPAADGPPSPAAGGGAPAGADAPPGGAGQPAPAVRSPTPPELPGGPQMCDLGRRYGGWAAGSMPEDVCERAYGG